MVTEASERTFLVGFRERKGELLSGEDSLAELEELARTAKAEIVGSTIIRLDKIDPGLFIGKGKARELSLLRQQEALDLIIFDDELSPRQQSNLQDIIGCRVIDRSALILQIFADRAQTREGQLQVELAQLNYMLPRLTGMGTSLSRLGGGIGTRGPGETKLETDRRHIRKRISDLEAELEVVKKQRKVMRQQRETNQIPVCLLYTSLKYVHINVEGAFSYRAILYIPEKPPFDFYTKEYEKGLELYANGVLIMNKCPELLPDYFSFVKGMVDSDDLSLNISREILQHDRQLQLIAKNIRTKIKNELENLLKTDREKYEKFYNSFGRQLKYGVYSEFGSNREILQDLLMFYSSTEKKLVTLAEYVSRMPEEQKYIYYASGESIERIAKLPQTELVADKGYEILYFTDDVDEFAIKMIPEYQGKELSLIHI